MFLTYEVLSGLIMSHIVGCPMLTQEDGYITHKILKQLDKSDFCQKKTEVYFININVSCNSVTMLLGGLEVMGKGNQSSFDFFLPNLKKTNNYDLPLKPMKTCQT